MRQSKLFSRISKTPPREEISRNAKFLVQGRFIDKLMAGVYTYLPLGLRVIKRIEQIIREEMNAIGGQEIYMPALHPLENYIITKRDKIDVLFHLESASGKKLVLGQSHEEIIVPLVKKHISSYKDLPLYLYQIQVKFRNELRAKSGILRGREFAMKDLYSFHKDENDFEKYYQSVQAAYHNIFRRVGLGDLTYLTYASGGTFSKYSHEFQTITPAGEDNIFLCEKCKIAVNKEMIEAVEHRCPQCENDDLKLKKAIEVGNIFPLKTKFSDAFDLKYIDQAGQKKPIVMGCYGIGLGRVMGTVVEINSDQKGIIWPKAIAPYEVHLILLDKQPKIKEIAEKAYNSLQKQGVQVIYDDRLESAGVKLNDADLIGIPIRLIISEKTKDEIELKFRNSQQPLLLSQDKVMETITEYYQS